MGSAVVRSNHPSSIEATTATESAPRSPASTRTWPSSPSTGSHRALNCGGELQRCCRSDVVSAFHRTIHVSHRGCRGARAAGLAEVWGVIDECSSVTDRPPGASGHHRRRTDRQRSRSVTYVEHETAEHGAPVLRPTTARVRIREQSHQRRRMARDPRSSASTPTRRRTRRTQRHRRLSHLTNSAPQSRQPGSLGSGISSASVASAAPGLSGSDAAISSSSTVGVGGSVCCSSRSWPVGLSFSSLPEAATANRYPADRERKRPSRAQPTWQSFPLGQSVRCRTSGTVRQ